MRLKSKFQCQYCKALAVVHGASELQIVRYVKSMLHLPLEIYSRDNGGNSIQINGLMNILNNSSDFNKPKKFLNKYSNIESKKGMPVNFKVFPIMDTDDCADDEIREDYIDGTLFDGHWMKPYLKSIYNSPSLEDVMLGCELIERKPSDKEKTSTYKELFPITNCNNTNYEEIEELYNRFKGCNNTNFELFIEYCLEWARGNKIK